jgi:hypothetical protein
MNTVDKFLATVRKVSLFGSGDLEYFAFKFCQDIMAQLESKQLRLPLGAYFTDTDNLIMSRL